MRHTHTTWTTTVAAGALALGLLGGCAAAGGEPSADGSAKEPGETHTMADGTVMGGPEHDGREHVHSGHDHGEGGAHGGEDAVGPSETASMICGGSVAADVQRIMGLDELPEPASTWQAPMFRCTFELEQGPLVLSVHDVSDVDEGMAHFEGRRAALGPVRELKGMYGLGLPAFETTDGTAAFIREGKTLEVDATALSARMGPDRSLDQGDLAYAVATSVLACWTEHS